MQRRQFIAASIATSAAALAGQVSAQAPEPNAREFYQLRRYELTSGPQLKLTQDYLAHALIPALGRMGLGPVGAFRLEYGQQTPMIYVVIPGPSADVLATLDLHLGADEDFLKVASPFWDATAEAPAFQRVEISLLQAFQGWPKIVPPASAATKSKRIVQLRTYESPSNGEHVRKVEMFNSGEFEIFRKAGCNPVFFADALFGSRLPKLSYMLSFENMAALEAGWALFLNDPDWKKLAANPRFAFDPIVSNVSDLIMNPLSCSQI
jgi:hypothetical protein